MKIVDIKTKKICENCGGNLLKNSRKIMVGEFLFCINCEEYARFVSLIEIHELKKFSMTYIIFNDFYKLKYSK